MTDTDALAAAALAEREAIAADGACRAAHAAHRRACTAAVAELRGGLRPDDPLAWWYERVGPAKAELDAAQERLSAAQAARQLAGLAVRTIEASWPAERRAMAAEIARMADELEVFETMMALGGATLTRDRSGRITAITKADR
jgi:hypothetical protein